MRDNASPFPAKEYDDQMNQTMPFYRYFYDSIIDLVKTVNTNPDLWLDTGCGTGSFVKKAASIFNNTEFFLADPSQKMLEIAKNISNNIFENTTAALQFPDVNFDVITAILCHHYLNEHDRILSTENCFRMLKSNGLYITFENIRFLSQVGIDISMNCWWNYKLENEVNPDQREGHFARYDNEYHPITLFEHINLLKECGFRVVEMFYMSYMQAGFFAIK